MADHLNFRLRLPPGLHGKLQEAAEENGRSLHTEIMARLVASLDPSWSGYITELERQERQRAELFERLKADPAHMAKLMAELKKKERKHG